MQYGQLNILRYAHVPPQSSISLGSYHHFQIEDDAVLDVIYAALFIWNMDPPGAPQSIVQKIWNF